MMHKVRSGTVLHAKREDIELHTSDGLTLVGELALPAEGAVTATLVTLHPLPTAGGFMDSHLLKKASYRLPELANVAVLRFNTRGTASDRGKSEGTFDGGVAEREDLSAAMRFVQERGLPNPWLIGWSFGTELVLKYGLNFDIAGAILLSPPLHRTSAEELQKWQNSSVPLIALIPEHDDFLPPEPARERFAVVPRAQLIEVDGAKHLWVGEAQVRRVFDEIVTATGATETPLPTEVDKSKLEKVEQNVLLTPQASSE